MATWTAALGGATLTAFQDGVAPDAAYAGTRDTTLVEQAPGTSFGAAATCFVDGDDPGGTGLDVVALLRWDLAGIPADAVVQSVTLTLQVTNPTHHGYQLYGLLRPWSEATATWTQAATGEAWQAGGAAGGLDRSATAVASVTAPTTGQLVVSLDAAGVALVQGWLQDPSQNQGFVLAGGGSTNGLDFASREASTTTARPRLEIAWLPAGAEAPPAPASLVPWGATWQYRDSGSDPGPAWRDVAYDDSAWQSGAAELGYGDGDEATVVSFGADAANKHVTTWFRRTVQVQDAAAWQSLTVRLVRDDGAAVYLNGVEILRSNLPGGTLTPSTLASVAIGNQGLAEAAVDPALLVEGSNVIAVEVHQAAARSSDLSFDLELTGTTGSPPPAAAAPLVAKGATWKFRDTGVDPGPAWPTAGYDDAAWASGPARLGYGEGIEATLVSYGGSASSKHVTTWFRRSFTADPAAWQALGLAVLCDDGVRIFLNGNEVLRHNLTSGTVTAATLATKAVDDAGWVQGSVDPQLLLAGTNVLAAEVHQVSASSSDLAFDLELAGTPAEASGPCPAGCDDGNACTGDTCGADGCAHVAVAGPCNDGDACTTADACQAGQCQGAAIACDDGNGCTTDSCDAATGCKNVANTLACDDGNACTVGDACASKACAGAAKDCGDGDACTADSCSASGACVHVALCGNRFQATWGGSGTDQANAVKALSDGFVLAGSTTSFGAGGDGLVVRTDACGKPAWVRTYGGSAAEVFFSADTTSDGGFVLAGEAKSADTDGDAWVVRTDAAGALQWQYVHGGAGHDFAQSVMQTSDGGYVVAAKTYSYGPNTPTWHNGLLFKISAAGKLVWTTVLGANDGSMDAVQIREVRNAAGAWDGYLLIGGSEGFGQGADDVWLTRLGSDGSHTWSLAYGGSGDDDPTGFVQTPDQGFLIAGITKGFSASGGSADLFVMKVANDGSLGWFRRFGGAATDETAGIALQGSGAVVTGRVKSWGAGLSDAFALRVDGAGGVLSMRTFGGGADDYGLGAVALADGGFALAGRTASDGKGGFDAWLVRAGSDGKSGCSEASVSLSGTSYTPAKTAFTPVILTAGSAKTFSVTQGSPSASGGWTGVCACQ